MNSLIEECRSWFEARNLTAAVVGYSGGVDSATTLALFARAGLEVHPVVAEAPRQGYSSPLGGERGCLELMMALGQRARPTVVTYPHLFSSDVANEASAPIVRNAIFYGRCAELRAQGIGAIVVGTANFDEAAYLGFWGKASDGSQDFYPLSHLHKREVRALAQELGVPDVIREAVPSGDLLFRETNDLEMIGADYALVERLAFVAESGGTSSDLAQLISTAPDPDSLCRQILSNEFKYDLPFPGHHLSNRLEAFRKKSYPQMVKAVTLASSAC